MQIIRLFQGHKENNHRWKTGDTGKKNRKDKYVNISCIKPEKIMFYRFSNINRIKIPHRKGIQVRRGDRQS